MLAITEQEVRQLMEESSGKYVVHDGVRIVDKMGGGKKKGQKKQNKKETTSSSESDAL